MSLTVVVQETALRALARIRSEDKESFGSIRQALSALAEQPRPAQAIAWGGSGIYRLHLPGIRILYEVDDNASTVYVINVAITPEGSRGLAGRGRYFVRSIGGRGRGEGTFLGAGQRPGRGIAGG